MNGKYFGKTAFAQSFNGNKIFSKFCLDAELFEVVIPFSYNRLIF